MSEFLRELGKLSPGALSAVVALAGLAGVIIGAIITGVFGKILVTPFLSARDQQDKEAEWRKHAIELTKLDLERKLKTRSEADKTPVRPSIMDFLANYRDLQELGVRTPKELYIIIDRQRITRRAEEPASPDLPEKKSSLSSVFLRLRVDPDKDR